MGVSLIIKNLGKVSKFISTLISSIILSIVYLIGIGVPALIAKLVGKKFIETEKKRSYWVDINNQKTLEESYRQF
jgi:hypothetical protein